VDEASLTALEKAVGELRADLNHLKRLGHDTSVDEELLAELELLLATIRDESRRD
jgi:hypothetical protein